MNGRRWLLPVAIAVALAQIGFLFSMISGRAAILRDGREVTLAVEPVDPRDLLRGDYVVLGYNISQLPADLFHGGPPDQSRVVFVRLKQTDGDVWEPVSARYGARPEPEPADGEVDIKGRAEVGVVPETFAVRVVYGIERFYVPEGEGREIEAGLGARAFRMKVAVARDGTAQIKSFHDGDTMLYAEPVY